jgi:predicted amidohydrolase
MSRQLTIGVGQLGPVARDQSRQSVVRRLIALLEQGKLRGCALVVFPEMALTTFFPRWHIEDEAELESYFEREMPNAATRPLFDAAAELGVGFYLGYCELAEVGGRKRRFNSAVLVDAQANIVGKYRKVHVPGSAVNDPSLPFQHLEQLYFETGDLGFPVWPAFGARVGMCICNDRRWPETYRVMGLQGAELALVGYNTPAQMPDWPEQNELRVLHHLVPMQAAAYQNGIWIAAAAKAGREEGVEMLAHSCVIAPSGEVVALTRGRGDELIAYECDLEMSAAYKRFHDVARNRKPQHYGLIAAPSVKID